MNPYKVNPYLAKKKRASGTWSKPQVVNGVKFRSRWEWYVSKLLIASAIEYKYEPQRFYFGNGVSYLPDFYLIKEGIFVEVKGWMRPKDLLKITRFREKAPFRLVLLDTNALTTIFGAPASNISKLDLRVYKPNAAELSRFAEALKGN